MLAQFRSTNNQCHIVTMTKTYHSSTSFSSELNSATATQEDNTLTDTSENNITTVSIKRH